VFVLLDESLHRKIWLLDCFDELFSGVNIVLVESEDLLA